MLSGGCQQSVTVEEECKYSFIGRHRHGARPLCLYVAVYASYLYCLKETVSTGMPGFTTLWGPLQTLQLQTIEIPHSLRPLDQSFRTSYRFSRALYEILCHLKLRPTPIEIISISLITCKTYNFTHIKFFFFSIFYKGRIRGGLRPFISASGGTRRYTFGGPPYLKKFWKGQLEKLLKFVLISRDFLRFPQESESIKVVLTLSSILKAFPINVVLLFRENFAT